MPGYSTTPLPKKLGIREGALVAAPPCFSKLLEPLPNDCRVLDALPKKDRFDVAIVRVCAIDDTWSRLRFVPKT